MADAHTPRLQRLVEQGLLEPVVRPLMTGLYQLQEGAIDLETVMREADAARNEKDARILRMRQAG